MWSARSNYSPLWKVPPPLVSSCALIYQFVNCRLWWCGNINDNTHVKKVNSSKELPSVSQNLIFWARNQRRSMEFISTAKMMTGIWLTCPWTCHSVLCHQHRRWYDYKHVRVAKRWQTWILQISKSQCLFLSELLFFTCSHKLQGGDSPMSKWLALM
jgi:hypothetical protein